MSDLTARLGQLRDRLGLNSRDRILGFTFIFAVATIWVIASFAVQGIESSGVHPAVLTYIANSLFALYLPIYWANLRIKQRRERAAGDASEGHALFPHRLPRSDDASDAIEDPASPIGSPLAPPQAHEEPAVASALPAPETPRSALLRAALVVAPLWFLAQLTFNASLKLTSVTSNTILSSASALFTFLFAVVFLSERFTLIKLASIVALMGGTAMVTLADAGAGGGEGGGGINSVLGDALCLLSAVIYGAYTVSIRRMLGQDEGVAMTLFFGFMGGLIFVGIGPFLGIAAITGADLGSLSWVSFGAVVAKGLLDNVLSDYLWARAILLVGPTLATAGLSMQVPIAVTLDALIRHPRWLTSVGTAVLTFVGGAVVLAAFFVLTASSTGEERVERAWERHSAALEAELGATDDEEELNGLGYGGEGGTGGFAPHRLRQRSPPTSPTRLSNGGIPGGLAPLPPEPKYSLD